MIKVWEAEATKPKPKKQPQKPRKPKMQKAEKKEPELKFEEAELIFRTFRERWFTTDVEYHTSTIWNLERIGKDEITFYARNVSPTMYYNQVEICNQFEQSWHDNYEFSTLEAPDNMDGYKKFSLKFLPFAVYEGRAW